MTEDLQNKIVQYVQSDKDSTDDQPPIIKAANGRSYKILNKKSEGSSNQTSINRPNSVCCIDLNAAASKANRVLRSDVHDKKRKEL